MEFDAASPGMVGLETSVGLVVTHLLRKEHVSLPEMVEKMALAPRRILNLKVPEIKEGEEANLTVLDTNKEWKVDKTKFRSKSRNTQFDGWELAGKTTAVYHHGIWYSNEENA